MTENATGIPLQNMGRIERIIRVALGVGLLGFPLAWYGLDNMTNWGFLGLIPLITGLKGWCPLYAAFGNSR